MRNVLLTSIASVGLMGSLQAATVLADRIVVTNSILNANGNTTVATHWAEVQVFQLTTGTNIAASANGGTATANSTGYGGVPSRANDGNTDGNFGNGSVYHDNDPDPVPGAAPDVFTIAFSGLFSVDSFNIWGRSDTGTERDNNFVVEFYNGTTLVGRNSTGITATSAPFSTGVTPIIAVPEPTSFATGLLSLGVLGLRRRRA